MESTSLTRIAEYTLRNISSLSTLFDYLFVDNSRGETRPLGSHISNALKRIRKEDCTATMIGSNELNQKIDNLHCSTTGWNHFFCISCRKQFKIFWYCVEASYASITFEVQRNDNWTDNIHCYPVNYLPVIKGGRKLSHTMMSIH